MNSWIVAGLLLVLVSIGYQVGWAQARGQLVVGSKARSHSRPAYHGARVAIWALAPALAVLALWALFGNSVAVSYVGGLLPAELPAGVTPDIAIQRIRSIAAGANVAGGPQPYEVTAADALRSFLAIVFFIACAAMAATGIAALLWARARITPRLRARETVERVVKGLLIACSVVAIMTTLGIVASLLTEALRFFTFINPIDFFFGTVWNPVFSSTGHGGAGQYGLLPLLWGTLMVSAIAVLVALPLGLMTAIYLNQYAPRPVRAVVKPIIEVLAGIPTIVYGFFALVAIGPFFRNAGAAVGLDVSATSALTAGVVLGIMIIPFISSLSDDILNQVPRAMRDGAYGLGATRSETIRQVLLPAALPGIVGAFLLAVSRAIGETMIVVLAAGNSPVLRINPLEPISTVTVSIVNQLTGDTDFSGPQSLVAFALGLTLFVMTLGLNVIALYIVNRFREQYE